MTRSSVESKQRAALDDFPNGFPGIPPAEVATVHQGEVHITQEEEGRPRRKSCFVYLEVFEMWKSFINS